ncbi:molybdenum cofactor guanylyltransferase [Paenibacillus cellulosilyticus]|uniref:Probable molybdenum cofactor guanylyltransferase n=1 Tax=Paenibacillus cellulosilyticus TaxID=375489 RepID=A0A2V2YPT5_9BACL|nr:molybdenum cofactor guanylyltransferase [Paenibacillus cellulosilyticus]PWV98445.1 molybdenum cofactor guanylyltransferase [Paenibacillus cellulosilyticus]QKS43289.1 molybdenum cofactor guanylyltransferase [Paenibacillus cellulosilyticus]
MLDVANPLPCEEKVSLSGVILAGGQSRRMGGSPKALLTVQHEKMVQRQMRILKQLCSEVILVTNEPKTYLPFVDSDVRIITDYYAGQGPLAGMHAGLSLARHEDVWIVGCDMPYLSTQAAMLMLGRKRERGSDAVVPSIEGKIHPLHGIYDKRCVDRISSMLNQDQRRVNAFLERIAFESIHEWTFERLGIDTRFVFNMNTPEQYEQLLSMEKQTEEGSGVGCSDRS